MYIVAIHMYNTLTHGYYAPGYAQLHKYKQYPIESGIPPVPGSGPG